MHKTYLIPGTPADIVATALAQQGWVAIRKPERSILEEDKFLVDKTMNRIEALSGKSIDKMRVPEMYQALNTVLTEIAKERATSLGRGRSSFSLPLGGSLRRR